MAVIKDSDPTSFSKVSNSWARDGVGIGVDDMTALALS